MKPFEKSFWFLIKAFVMRGEKLNYFVLSFGNLKMNYWAKDS